MLQISTEKILNLTDHAGGAELFEICIEAVTVFFCFLLMVVLFRSYPYHVHLWAFVVNLVIIIAFYTVFRLIKITTSFSKVKPADNFIFWISIVQHSATYSEAFAILAIVGERTLAAKFSNKYEKSRQFGLCAFVIVLSWIFPAIFTIFSLYLMILPYPILLGATIALCVISTIIMVLLKLRLNMHHKKRLVKWSKTADILNNELSRQYQLKENIRSSRFLLPLILFLNFTSFMVVTLLTLKVCGILSAKIFNFVFALRALVLPIFITRAHSVFRKQLIFILSTASNLVSSSDCDIPASRVARSGQVYAVSNEASMEIHFASLQDAWERYDSIK